MLPKAETPRTSVFATNSAVAYHDSRCGLHRGKNLKQICGTALQTYSARLNTAGGSCVVFLTGRNTDSLLLLGFPPVSQLLLSPALQVSYASALSATFQTSSKRRIVPSHSQQVAGWEGKKTATGWKTLFTLRLQSHEPTQRLTLLFGGSHLHLLWVFNQSSDHRRFHRRLGRECIVSPCFVLQRVAIPPRSSAGNCKVEGVRQVVRQQG